MPSLHLVDGTYELFRAFYGAPSARVDGREVGAARGLVSTLLGLVTREGASHVAVAFDTVIESFRNGLFAGYKTGAGIDPALAAQFSLAEEVAEALGLVVLRMIDVEADDALATLAARFAQRADRVWICSPDKDLAQCVRGDRVVLHDRRRGRTLDETGVREKFGVGPASIPDWLGLVGDASDGIPGLPRWGERSAAAVLARWNHLEGIPRDPAAWEVPVRGAAALAESLHARWDDAVLFRTLATLRQDVPALPEDLEALAFRGADRERAEQIAERLGERRWLARVPAWRGR
jgi:5'-3' exonuclease